MQKLPVLLAFIFSISACQSELTQVDIPNENKLVVESYISPQDTVLSVRVSNSSAIYGQVTKGVSYVSNAVVSMSDGTKTISLSYDKDGYYRISANQLLVKTGKSYFLKISTPDRRLVSGECTIPNTVDNRKLSVDVQKNNTDTKEISIKWTDFANEQNYYAITGTFETVQKGCNSSAPFYFRDKNRDGEQFSFTFNTNVFCGNGNPNYLIILANYDLNGYQYFSSVIEQNSVNGVPFTEPVQIFTNIKGGYGVFSGYNQLRTVVKVF